MTPWIRWSSCVPVRWDGSIVGLFASSSARAARSLTATASVSNRLAARRMKLPRFDAPTWTGGLFSPTGSRFAPMIVSSPLLGSMALGAVIPGPATNSRSYSISNAVPSGSKHLEAGCPSGIRRRHTAVPSARSVAREGRDLDAVSALLSIVGSPSRGARRSRSPVRPTRLLLTVSVLWFRVLVSRVDRDSSRRSSAADVGVLRDGPPSVSRPGAARSPCSLRDP